MPLYEYFCKECNVVFNFMSAKVAPSTVPECPKCHLALIKHLSSFSTPQNSADESLGFDEKRVENAFSNLLTTSQSIPTNSEKDINSLMESFTKECGFEYGEELRETFGDDNSVDQDFEKNAKKLLFTHTPKVAEKSGNSEKESNGGKHQPPEIDSAIYHM